MSTERSLTQFSLRLCGFNLVVQILFHKSNVRYVGLKILQLPVLNSEFRGRTKNQQP